MSPLPVTAGVRRFSLVGAFVVVFALIAGLIWVGVLRVGRSFVPEGNSSDEVPGLSADVSIDRDLQGIPYITATNELDAYAAVGYAHAQDRLWQMDIVRRAGEGRLSEVFGRSSIGYDALLRTIGFKRVAERILARMPKSTRAALEAYSRGVNRFIETHRGRYPFEFDALDYEPEPWTPLHSVLVSRLLGWELNGSFWIDGALSTIRGRVDSARFAEILPSWPADGPTIIPGGAAQATPSRGDSARRRSDSSGGISGILEPPLLLEHNMREFIGIGGSHIGSNAWAIAPKLTTSGRAMLANDPHLMHTAPGRWYQVVMLIGREHRAGVTIPGVPFIVIGRNDRIAWGITSMCADETDYYLERLDSVKHTKALHDGAWEPLRILRDTISVRDSASVPILIRFTRHGPIVSDVHPQSSTLPVRDSLALPLDTVGPFAREAVSLRWTGADPSQELTAFERLNRATNLDQFTSAVRLGGVPALVFVYADAGGRIAAIPSARVPVRERSSDVALPGWDSRFNWRGFVPPERLPRLVDPSRGFVASANNKIANALAFDIGNVWEDPSRAQRLEQLLQEGNRFAVVDFVQMQSDVVSPQMLMMRDYLMAAFPDSSRQRPLVRQAIARLRAWNGSMVASSPDAAIAAVWFQKVVERTFGDELGPSLFPWFVQMAQLPIKALRRIVPTESQWFDDIRTPAVESREITLRRALSEALQWLRARYGDSIATWRYGAFHTLRMPHVLGRVERLRTIVDVGPIELGGSNTTLNNGEWDFNRPYNVRLGPSMRQIVDFGDTAVFMRSVVTTGTSGQPLSQFYANQMILWSANGHVNLLSRAPTGSDVSSRTVLRPASS